VSILFGHYSGSAGPPRGGGRLPRVGGGVCDHRGGAERKLIPINGKENDLARRTRTGGGHAEENCPEKREAQAKSKNLKEHIGRRGRKTKGASDYLIKR